MSPRDDIRSVEAPPGSFHAVRGVPGDKSLSHRALIFAAFARGTSEVVGLGPGRDIAATARVLRSLGVTIAGDRVFSAGVEAWSEPAAPLQCENSGTTMRLMAGAVAGRPFTTTLVGDRSLSRRPMRRLVGPLEVLGARVRLSTEGTAPVIVEGPASGLVGGGIDLEVASAQVRSAFLLAALQADGPSTVRSPPGFRDHTERWLEALGLGDRSSPTVFTVRPGPVPAGRFTVPGDPSSAAFLWTAAALRPGCRITTTNVSLNPGRIGFLQVLEAMGAGVEAEVTEAVGGDPVGTVTVLGAPLRATEVSGDLSVAALDELPLVAVLGAMAEGITTVRDARELRAKESDRIASTVAMIRALGGGAEPAEDGFQVVGTGFLESGTVDSEGDHRIAMAAGVAAIATRGPVHIVGARVANVSWPDFFDELESVWSLR